MISPYEAERLFEVEITRMHQYDDDLYGCGGREEEPVFSFRAWLAEHLLHKPSTPAPPKTGAELLTEKL